MTADLFIGSLTILTMAAIVIVSLTGTRDRNLRNNRRPTNGQKSEDDQNNNR